MLTEQVASKSKALQETRNRLDETREHLDRTQTERDQSRQRLEDLIEAIPDAVALFDEERLLVLGNASFFEFWAGSGAVIEVGKTRLTDLGRLAANHGLFDSDIRSAGRTSSPRSEAGDSLFRMADGRWLQMAERATVDGGLVVAYTDVTEVKASELNARERTVRAHDNLLHELLANLPQGVALVDEVGCIRVCNPRFRKLLR
jgi:PAS domain-containing protein